MALFSFRHSVKTFSPKCETANRKANVGQTAAHLNYITRASAARVVHRERVEYGSNAKQASAVERAAIKRRGRVCERFIIALPIEASPTQREALELRFAEKLTQGKAGFILAIHDKAGNDTKNPHFHLVAFDYYEKSGGRGRPSSLLGMARKNAIEQKAKLWARIHNDMMSAWGFGAESSISHLSFADRGLDLIPQIHEGPASRQIAMRKGPIRSKPAWRHIDAGRTRADANQITSEINQLKRKIKNDNRLGSGNEGGSLQGDGSRPPWGKNSGGRRRSVAITPGAEQEVGGHRESHGRNTEPPWVAGGGPTVPPITTEDHPPIRQEPPPMAAPKRRDRLRLGHRPIRRIFLELIFLRDTLRSRLATQRRRHRNLWNSKVAEDHLSHELRFKQRVGDPESRS